MKKTYGWGHRKFEAGGIQYRARTFDDGMHIQVIGPLESSGIHVSWEQLDYGETTNGISFEKSLSSGTYSRLEFYYYTNHDCMYDKSNITYTVDYYFE